MRKSVLALNLIGIPTLLTLGYLLFPTQVDAQCNGVFPSNTICGNLGPSPAPPAAFTAGISTFGPGTATPSNFVMWGNSAGTQLTNGPASPTKMALNVQWFGAVGDGVTDNTAVISSLLSSNPNGNIELYFPAGTYITSPIVLNGLLQGYRISGDGPGASTIKLKTGVNSVFITMGTSAADQYDGLIDSITIDGNASNQTAGDCLHISNVRIARITNAEINNCYQHGIVVNDFASRQTFASGMEMVNSHVHDWGKGGSGNAILVGQFNEAVLIANSWINTGPAGTDQGHSGIVLTSSTNPVSIVGNDIFTNAPGIFVNGTSVSLTGNLMNYLGANSQCLVGFAMTHAHIGNNECVMSVGLTANPFSLTNGSKDNIFCGNSVNTNGAVAVQAGFQEDSTSKPNYYCGATPTIGNLITGTLSAYYTANGPTAGAGTASILGCTAGACTISTDYAGSLTTSTAITSATINFSTNWLNNTPACTISSGATSPIAAVTAITSSTLTIGFGNATSSAVITYNCVGAK